MQIIGIDPSLKNSAVAIYNGQELFTKHIPEVCPGSYTKAIKEIFAESNPEFADAPAEWTTAGFVEDFTDIGGPDAPKSVIAVLNHSGGMAEEALAALMIPVIPIRISEWRKQTLGIAPKTRTKSGKREMRYWTKGNKGLGVPNNVTPALLKFLDPYLDLRSKINPMKLPADIPVDHYKITSDSDWDFFCSYARYQFTARRIQLIFGVSVDEMEAGCIAIAGYRLIDIGQIEGIPSPRTTEPLVIKGGKDVGKDSEPGNHTPAA